MPLTVGHARIRRVPFSAWMPPEDPDRPVTDLLCAEDADPATLWAPLADALLSATPQVSLLAIDRLEADSRLWRMLEAVSPERKALQPTGVVYKIPTGRDIEQLLAAASPKFRSNLRRRWRILGSFDFTVADTPTAVAAALESFLVLEASGWKAHEPTGNAILRRPAFATQVRQYISASAAAGCCSIYQLLANGRCAAALIALRGTSEVYIYKIAYDESMAQAAPAHLLLERCLAVWCADPSLTTCNGGPEAPWLRPWRPVESRLWTAYVGLGSVKSRAALALLQLPTLGTLLGRSS